MNRNIQVINDDLWLVDFEYVRQGYIKELTFSNENDNNFMTLTDRGEYVINKADEYHKRTIDHLIALMGIPDELIGTEKGFYEYMRRRIPKWSKKDDKYIEIGVKYYNLELQEDAYKALSEWEKIRRELKTQYKPKTIDKVKKFFRR